MSFLSKLFKKRTVRLEPTQSEECAAEIEQQPLVQVHVSINTTTPKEEPEPIGQLSCLDFGKTTGELGCYLNYEPRMLCPPTEKQVQYLKDLGVDIPEGITKEDASHMISRAVGDDSIEGPSLELYALAVGLGVKFSAFIGAKYLFNSIICNVNIRDRAALYVYAVMQNLRGAEFGNMLEDPKLAKYYSVADRLIADPTLVRSLQDRKPEDFKKPHRGTAIYKATIASLQTE